MLAAARFYSEECVSGAWSRPPTQSRPSPAVRQRTLSESRGMVGVEVSRGKRCGFGMRGLGSNNIGTSRQFGVGQRGQVESGEDKAYAGFAIKIPPQSESNGLMSLSQSQHRARHMSDGNRQHVPAPGEWDHESPLDVRRSGFATNSDGFGARPYTLVRPFFGRLGGGGGGDRECCSNASMRAATLPPRAGGGLGPPGVLGVMAVGDSTRPSAAELAPCASAGMNTESGPGLGALDGGSPSRSCSRS